jgi:hypothetical protein
VDKRERRRVGGSSSTPLPSQAWPGRITSAKPATILHIRGQRNVSAAWSPATRMMGSRPTKSETNYVAIGALPYGRARALRISEQPMAPATTRARSGSAPASFTAPIEISTAIAIRNANTGLSTPAAATTENLVQVGNRPMAGPQVVATWAILGVGWPPDGLSTSVASPDYARGLADVAQDVDSV